MQCRLGSLTAILPTLNEAENVRRTLMLVCEALSDSAERFEIVVVDDHSEDATVRIARECARDLNLPVRVFVREGQRDLAKAVLFGARKTDFEYVVVLDADLSHDPRDIGRLAAALPSADVAVGSRYVRIGVGDCGTISAWPLRRRIISQLGSFLARRLTTIADPLSGFFACRRSLLVGELPMRPSGYKILFELLARGPHLQIAEVPIEFKDRAHGESKFGFRQAMQFGFQLLRIGVWRAVSAIRRGAIFRSGCSYRRDSSPRFGKDRVVCPGKESGS